MSRGSGKIFFGPFWAKKEPPAQAGGNTDSTNYNGGGSPRGGRAKRRGNSFAQSRKEKEGQYAGDRCRTEGWAGGKGKKRRNGIPAQQERQRVPYKIV